MSNSCSETPPSPESTYVPGGNPAANKLARQLFFISVGSSAVPVLAAAIIMLQGGQRLPPKTANAPSAQKASARLIAPLAAEPHAAACSMRKVPPSLEPFADHAAASRPSPISSSALPVKQDSVAVTSPDSAPVAELSSIRSQPFVNPADVVGQIQTLQSGNGILQRSAPLTLALVSIPITSSIRESEAVAVPEKSADSHTVDVTTSQPKRIRAEIKAHRIAHYRHRPQRHAPPSLFAKISQSVKKGLSQIAKVPGIAMERHSRD